MSDEHGWPDFHDPDGHDDPGHHELDPGDTHDPVADLPSGSMFHDDLFGGDAADPGDPHDEPLDADHLDDLHEPGADPHDEPGSPHDVVDATDGHGLGPVGADPDATPDVDTDPVSMFPPVVDVGPLPEPVDGFPWIDTGSLGLVDAGLVDPAHGFDPVQAGDLAEYAAEELTPGVDPWAALADSDDPATSTLARWWAPEA